MTLVVGARRGPNRLLLAALVLALGVGGDAYAVDHLGLVQSLTAEQRGLGQLLPSDVLVSPDGRHVYVSGTTSIVIFARDATTGRLTLVDVQHDPFGSSTPAPLAISPDGEHLYVGTGDVVVFKRDVASGRLLLVETHPGDGGGSIVVSSDGRHVYVARGNIDIFTPGSTVIVFERDGATGALTLLESEHDGFSGLDNFVLSPDGANAYAVSYQDDLLAEYARDATSGHLTLIGTQRNGINGVDGLGGPLALAISPDGLDVYSGGRSDGGLSVFLRDPMTGALTFLRAERGADIGFPMSISVRPDGGMLYLRAAVVDYYFATFLRGSPSGALLENETFQNHVYTSAPIASPDSRHVYAPSLGGLGVFQRITLACNATPLAGCRRPMLPGKSSLTIRGHLRFWKRTWTWTKGAATVPADFGDPLTATEFAFCVYDGAARPQPRDPEIAPEGNGCGKKPCWTPRSDGGWNYLDKERTPDGIQTMTLQAGPSGLARVAITGFPPSPSPLLPLVPPVTVQLQASTGVCWEAVFSTPKVNGSSFQAKSD